MLPTLHLFYLKIGIFIIKRLPLFLKRKKNLIFNSYSGAQKLTKAKTAAPER